MARWDYTCREFKAVRDILESDTPDTMEIIRKLIEICAKYEEKKWDFADDYAELREELEAVADDDLDDDEVNYYLDEFYDLCDSAKVFLDI